jgi:hypothetical protein
MIPGCYDAWNAGKPTQKVASSQIFAGFGPLGKISRDDDHVGGQLLGSVQKRLSREGAMRLPEMDV